MINKNKTKRVEFSPIFTNKFAIVTPKFRISFSEVFENYNEDPFHSSTENRLV